MSDNKLVKAVTDAANTNWPYRWYWLDCQKGC